MDDRERLGEVAREPARVLRGDGRAALRDGGEPARERRAVDELHDEAGDGAALDVRLDGVVERHERAVVERRQQLQLRPLTLGRGRVGAAAGQHLDGDLAAEHLVDGAVDARHAAGAHDLAHPVAVREHRARADGPVCVHAVLPVLGAAGARSRGVAGRTSHPRTPASSQASRRAHWEPCA
ncbi:hypothetical protein OVA14_11815 [Agrococcus sp. SL85]|nr:hypothetical protein [Agrococcus sp. SL85]WAC65966.1 hypothetical protein OVA14_11815 [Agrococcus sp. SL85]